MTSEMQPQTSSAELATTLDTLSTKLSTYLEYLGLPTDSVLVGLDERQKVINNMAYIMPALTEGQRSSAIYISKFSAACVVGLFDAALNYLWDEISVNNVPPIAEAIVRLPEDLTHSLLRTAFGMYTDPRLDASVRNNIRLLAPRIWEVCSEDAKYDIGLKHSSFSVNGEISRESLARDFLLIVKGLAYLPANTVAIEMTSALEALLAAHNGWNNFYNEPSPARLLQAFVPTSGNIPDSVSAKYVKVLTMCYIGNGYGVSSGAEPVYTDLINRWQDNQIFQFIKLTRNSEVASRLQFSLCQQRYQKLASRLIERATHPTVKLALGFIQDFSTHKLDKIGHDSRFQNYLKTL